MIPAKAEKPALELCDEAVFLLRRAPASAWIIYFIGTGPFLLALLYFWTDMTRGILQETRLVSGAFVLTLLFVWMKTCQSAFCARLWSVMSGVKKPKQTFRDWVGVAWAQSRIQPWGILIIPVALALTIPFAWAYAYYQNATVLGRAPKGQSLHVISLAQARLWPKQNNVALAGISALGLIISDLLILLFMAPQLLITFFGVKEVFHPNVWLLANTTFLALVCSLTYLLFDPLIKAFYTLRCFYGQSLSTGEDLRARLAVARTARPANAGRLAKVAAILFLFAAPLRAAESTPQQLDKSITETLESSEYNWRFPREVVEKNEEGWFASFFTSLGKWIGKVVENIFSALGRFLRWLFGRMPTPTQAEGSMFPWPSAKELFVLLGMVVVSLLLFILWKQKRRIRGTMPKMEALATMAVPDLAREDVSADQLPEDEWLALATKLAGEGELRLAIRALFLSALATMAGKNWIALAKFKSNRDYEREFRRRAASLPQALSAFGVLAAVYNRIWYGLHEPSADLVAQCQESVRVLKS